MIQLSLFVDILKIPTVQGAGARLEGTAVVPGAANYFKWAQ